MARFLILVFTVLCLCVFSQGAIVENSMKPHFETTIPASLNNIISIKNEDDDDTDGNDDNTDDKSEDKTDDDTDNDKDE